MIKKNKIYKLLSKDWAENYILTVKLLKENEDKMDRFHNTNIFHASLSKNPYHRDTKKSNNK